MREKTKYAVTFILIMAMALSMVPVMTAAPALAQPTDMIGAVTGWTWEWCYNTLMFGEECEGGYPYNTNSRDTIMVVFNGTWEPYVEPDWFRIDYTYKYNGVDRQMINVVPASAEYHEWSDGGDYALVFLTLPSTARPMATDATPTVKLVDEGGAVLDEVPGIDGIAPMLEINVEGDPHAGGLVMVTVTASEALDTAALLVDCDTAVLPTVEWFPIGMEEPDEYGGYCGGPGVEGCWWMPDEWLEDDTVVNWYFLMEPADPQDTFYIEVLAHDYTICDVDWWEHEKWSTESVFIQGKDTLVLHLWEGWNLISFPRTPVDPSLDAVFGDMGVTKVYTYNNYRWYGSAYDAESGTWRNPRGVRAIRDVEPGVGYWVYCSPLGEWPTEWYWYYLTGLASQKLGFPVYVNTVWNDLVVELEPAGTAGAAPPAYRLNRGWNLVGVPVLGSLDLMQLEYWGGMPTLTHVPMTRVDDFLSGVDWSSLFWYLPTLTADFYMPDDGAMVLMWPAGYHGTTPGTCDDPDWKVGFWMSAFSGLGLPFNLDQPVDLAAYEDYRGEFVADIIDYYFGGEFWGVTEYGADFEGGMYGFINPDGTVAGQVEGEICRDCEDGGYVEYFSGTFSGWYYPMDGIPVGGSFTGMTDHGNIIQGTYGGNVYMGDPDFVGSVQGCIYPVDAGFLEDSVPVVMPGYGYWVFVEEAGYLKPVR